MIAPVCAGTATVTVMGTVMVVVMVTIVVTILVTVTVTVTDFMGIVQILFESTVTHH